MVRVRALRPWVSALLAAGALAACAAPNPSFQDIDAAADDTDGMDAAPADAPADASGTDRPDAPLDTLLAREAPIPGAPDLRTGLIGYWKLDDAPGSQTARDSSGNGLDGTVENLDVRAVWVTGRRGGGFKMIFGDNRGGIRVDHKGRLDGLPAYTLSAWTYRTEVRAGDYDSVISRQAGINDGEVFNMMFVSGVLRAYRSSTMTGESNGHLEASVAAPLNRWVHVATTWDGRTLLIYQDGVEVGRANHAQPLATATTPLYIGTNINRNDDRNAYVGTLDDVMIHSVALSPQAIEALASGATPAGL